MDEVWSQPAEKRSSDATSGCKGKLPSSRYKGVVPQPNGRWGAQIYEKHHRVWLGTFNDEADAARAYDVAALRFRGRDAATNFTNPPPPLSDDDDDHHAELLFLASRSKAEIVDMLRKHTYHDELHQSKRLIRHYASSSSTSSTLEMPSSHGVVVARERLFEKAVTPSDVGKLNRLVIPKQHAEKHFRARLMMGGGGGAVLLNFEDPSGKVWRFRYSYWNSSQSYVLTKGWSRFVKEKHLKAGDVVSFHQSFGTEQQQQLYIDCKTRAMAFPWYIPVPPPPPPPPPPRPAVQVVRLFGVDLSRIPAGGGDAGNTGNNVRDHVSGWSGKRMREMELLPPRFCNVLCYDDRKREEGNPF